MTAPRLTGLVPAGTTATAPFDLVITPEDAGWGYSSLRVITLPAGGSAEFATGGDEMILLPLRGGVDVTVAGETIAVAGRADLFGAVTDFAYLPIGSDVRLDSVLGGTFALPGARATRALPFRYGPADGVAVELRGSGQASRQVNNFAMAATFETDKLLACEVITPAANWSSYPPHKHDEAVGEETELEEIYYYAFSFAGPDAVVDASGAAPRGVGYQRVYGTDEREIEVLAEVGDGDTVLIPHGWHGPSIASPSHHMYYLNVMAGPGAGRAWGISDDPHHGWVRQTWAEQAFDPRLPFPTVAPSS
ncbi:5-deoxy-glucuronate isomerase [Nakamurella flavida]|uniref:5-deoxy-glucuronate isomerase n=1 Tax=Nakamurella flavida TaxID=363630 RepID=A0A938YQC2_9ACTN|nr:5-deoxy-glucuronate isomerase [Nakamurella flavida]MBM9477293.1 5-deoxy-glucuronate isomerase [Nakamurella flavida]MDP9779749.1 5-deoxy-glucuronate isomerase [Nakamurella flavida]